MEKNKIPDEIIKIISQQINNVPSQFDIDFDIKLLNESIKNKKRLWYYDSLYRVNKIKKNKKNGN